MHGHAPLASLFGWIWAPPLSAGPGPGSVSHALGCPLWAATLKYNENETGFGMSSRAVDVSVLVASSSGLYAYEVS